MGDDLFIEAFNKLFPEHQFEFTDNITEKHLQDVSVIFFGGGSFLDGAPDITIKALEIIKTKKILYIGIGIETAIHPVHMELLKIAKLVAIRSTNLDTILSINPNTIFIPDLIYFLGYDGKSERKEKSVLILPNMSVIPYWSDQHWKHAAWSHFKTEFAQFLDYLIEDGYHIDMFPMSSNCKMNDEHAAVELINHMNNRNEYIIYNKYETHKQMTELFSKYNIVITQRYHGIILSELTRTPYIAIHHHNKLKTSYLSEGKFISYFEVSKQSLIDNFNDNYSKYLPSMPIERDTFRTLKQEVFKILNE